MVAPAAFEPELVLDVAGLLVEGFSFVEGDRPGGASGALMVFAAPVGGIHVDADACLVAELLFEAEELASFGAEAGDVAVEGVEVAGEVLVCGAAGGEQAELSLPDSAFGEGFSDGAAGEAAAGSGLFELVGEFGGVEASVWAVGPCGHVCAVWQVCGPGGVEVDDVAGEFLSAACGVEVLVEQGERYLLEGPVGWVDGELSGSAEVSTDAPRDEPGGVGGGFGEVAAGEVEDSVGAESGFLGVAEGLVESVDAVAVEDLFGVVGAGAADGCCEAVVVCALVHVAKDAGECGRVGGLVLGLLEELSGGGGLAAAGGGGGVEEVFCAAAFGDGEDVVVVAASGEADVEGFLGGGVVDEDSCGVDGSALGAVHGGGVAELGGGSGVVGWEEDGSALVVLGVDVAFGCDAGDGPQVAVLDEALAAVEGEASVVAAGDDAVALAGGEAVGEVDGGGVVHVPGLDAVVLGELVEGAHVVVGGGHHERAASLLDVFGPCLRDAGEHVWAVAAGEAVVCEVPVDVAVFAEAEAGLGFVVIGEAPDLVEAGGADFGGEHFDGAACADGLELPVVADESDEGSGLGGVAGDVGEVAG